MCTNTDLCVFSLLSVSVWPPTIIRLGLALWLIGVWGLFVAYLAAGLWERDHDA